MGIKNSNEIPFPICATDFDMKEADFLIEIYYHMPS